LSTLPPPRHILPPRKKVGYPYDVTVCIAALADAGQSLVFACDSKLSLPEVSGDRVALKCFPLSSRLQWWAMVAADEVSHVLPVIEEAYQGGMIDLSEATNRHQNVERIFVSAYQAVRRRYVEDLVLKPIGLDFGEWKTAGYAPDLMARIEAVDIGCEFVIFGFDMGAFGHIFTVGHPGVARNHNLTGYAAIGSGGYSALSSLLFNSVNSEMELPEVLYRVCEAKFMAESALGVGRHTYVNIARVGEAMSATHLSDYVVNSVRNAWEKEGKPRIPRGIVDELRPLLRRSRPTTEGQSGPQSPTADPLRQPPSPE
jgi:hypothetical protein